MGKFIVFLGITIVIAGLGLMLFEKWNILGNLPGDFHFSKGNLFFYFPVMTSIIISVIATILLNLFFRR